ncbi:MAG: NAD(P)-binding domain-containing protein [Actinomycetota bacterium]
MALTTPATTVYDIVIVGGSAAAVSVAISSQRSGLGLVRIVAPSSLAFPTIVGDEQLDVGYGETVTAIDAVPAPGDAASGEGRAAGSLVVTTTKQAYNARAVMVAQQTFDDGWEPSLPVPTSGHIHLSTVPARIDDQDILVVGDDDYAVELVDDIARQGGRVVLAGGGLDPTTLSPAAENALRRLERERKATLLYRSLPDSIGLVGGCPMAYFSDRRTPDLQFDDVIFAPPRQPVPAAELGVTEAALATGRIWFEGSEAAAEEGQQRSPGWRIGLDIAQGAFPDLDLAQPQPRADRRRQHQAAIDELRDEHYNAVITKFEPTHSDLWVLRVRPDQGDTSHLPGQYASLGLGYWEARIDPAEDAGLDQKWEKLIRRSYSISSRIFDEHGYLANDTGGNELEFYIVLVPPTEDNIPALTPRLALKRPGDRIYLGPKVAGRYTLADISDPASTVVLLSTGTGEAPHNAMVVELLSKGHHGPVVSAVSVRQWADLGYIEKHRDLERRYPNYHYLPVPTREPDVPKRYIQDLIRNDEFASAFGVELDPASTHVFLCGNPSMIGLPGEGGDGAESYPEPEGVVEILTNRGFTLDRRKQPGNIHYEEYW